MITLATNLQRIRYWEGQLLRAADLRDQIAVDLELRRLHDQRVHRAAGVAIGLTATLNDGAILVGCGLAYDCSGRALLVPREQRVPLPDPLESARALVLAADPPPASEVTLTFRDPDSVTPRDGVVLAIVEPGGGEPRMQESFRPAIARPFARPHIVSGQTIPGETNWQPWTIGETEVGVEVKIDASSFGFARTPHYFATVVAGRPDPELPPAWFVSVADPTESGFIVRLLLRRVTRESLDIVDPKAQVIVRPSLATPLVLSDNGAFVTADQLSRLLPIIERPKRVTAVSGATITLDEPLDSIEADELLGFGHLARTTVVSTVLSEQVPMQVTMDPNALQKGDVVVKLIERPESARPARVAEVFDDGTLELETAIAGLQKGDVLGVVGTVSVVKAVTGVNVTVTAPDQFHLGDVVVRSGNNVDASAPTTIVKKEADGTLVLFAAIDGLSVGSELGIATAAGPVLGVTGAAGTFEITVKDPVALRAGDVVSKLSESGGSSPPVRVEKIGAKKKIRLSHAIEGLGPGDVLSAGVFRSRATVVALSGTSATIPNAARFPTGAFVVKLDEDLSAGIPDDVLASEDGVLKLRRGLDQLALGDVIGLCSFPTPARDDPTASEILEAIDMTGTVVVSSVSDNKVTLKDAHRVRAGDFVGKITGYRHAEANLAPSRVLSAKPTGVDLSANIDGLLKGDTVGLSDIAQTLFQVRLESTPTVFPGDEVLLFGLDRITGETRSMSAIVAWRNVSAKTVVLYVTQPSPWPAGTTFRPADLSASVLFVRGSALSLIVKQDLFVSWVASEDPIPMPRPCVTPASPECPCGAPKES